MEAWCVVSGGAIVHLSSGSSFPVFLVKSLCGRWDCPLLSPSAARVVVPLSSIAFWNAGVKGGDYEE